MEEIKPINVAGQPKSFVFDIDDWLIELAAVCATLVYLFFYVVGRSTNKKLAQLWIDATIDYWKEQFVLVNPAMISDSACHYLFYASGRDNISRIYCTVSCSPRNDIISQVYSVATAARREPDIVDLQIHLEDDAEDFSFAILEAGSAAAYVKPRYDLYEFTKLRDVKKLVPSFQVTNAFPCKEYSIYSDNAEFVINIATDGSLNQLFSQTVENEKGLIDSIVYSRLPHLEPETKDDLVKELPGKSKILRIRHRLPAKSRSAEEASEVILAVCKLAVDLADYISLQISAEARSRIARIRQEAINKLDRRDEELRKVELGNARFAAKKEKMKLAAEKLSPEAQRKIEEKEKKKEARKSAQKHLSFKLNCEQRDPGEFKLVAIWLDQTRRGNDLTKHPAQELVQSYSGHSCLGLNVATKPNVTSFPSRDLCPRQFIPGHLFDMKHNNQANAVITILCRNSELQGVKDSLASFEPFINSRLKYPYVFLNNEPFTEDFKEEIIKELRKYRDDFDVKFSLIPEEHWSIPEFVDKEKARRLIKESEGHYPYGGMESYRFMIRYFSGPFYAHPDLQQYDYYWRVEPNVDFYCH
ncbi:MAG: hypothetical protein SGCHY_004830 [Lobulomycetales sp.]